MRVRTALKSEATETQKQSKLHHKKATDLYPLYHLTAVWANVITDALFTIIKPRVGVATSLAM